jgi:glycerate kinase
MKTVKIVIAPDSFKGSAAAPEAANAIEKGVLKAVPGAEIIKVPMADGGEGTVEAMITAAGGEIRQVEVTGPLGDKVPAFYGILYDGKTGVVEMAAASGLPLVPKEKRNPMLATSFGTGELIKMALEAGCRRLVIGIGGSATNDGGMGMLQALGVKFLDAGGAELGFGGGELERLASIDCSNLYAGLKDAEILAACDVTNPLCGPHGASHVFGPQKGATLEMVERLDKGLENFANRIKDTLGKDIMNMPGTGAAGGMGAGLVAFLGAVLKRGMEIMTEIAGIEKKVEWCDLVITGEGNTDFQTAFGKVPVGISRIGKKYGKPVICLSGGLGEGVETLYEEGITALFSIANKPMSLEMAMKNAGDLLTSAAENIIRLYSR